MSRKKTRLDGKKRPAVLRYRRRKTGEKRREWLANFGPGVRNEFFAKADVDRAVFLSHFQAEAKLDREPAAEMLRVIAVERGWLTLQTRDGLVVGIAPEKAAVAS